MSYAGRRPHGGGPSLGPGRNQPDADSRKAWEQREARRQEGRVAARDAAATKATFDAARRDFWRATAIWLAFGLSVLLSR